MASQVAMRVLIQTGRPLGELTETDLVEFDAAIGHRETVRRAVVQALPGRVARHPARCSTTWVHR